MELFKLFGRVLVETSDADKNLDKTDGKAKDLTSDLGNFAKSAGKWATAIGTAVVAVGSAIAKIVDEVAAKGDEIDKASQKLGVSAQFYQEWAYILEHNGTTMDSVGEAIFELSQKVGEADESILETLERIGIGANDALTMTPEDLWEAVIDGLMKIDSESERAAISTRLLGDKAKQLGPLLNSGAEATNDLKNKIHALGGVMSDTLVKRSAEYEDAVTDLKTAWQGFKYDLAENIIPGMTEIINGFTLMLTGEIIPGLQSAGQGILDFFKGIDDTLEETIGVRFFKNDIGAEIEDILRSDKYKYTYDLDGNRPGKFAVGLPFVPKDNYPALLHYGERVLTRQEAEGYNQGAASGGFNQTNYISTVAQSPAQTAAAIRAAFETARWGV